MKWISVDEELPEHGTPVLAYIADQGTVITTHYFDDFALIRSNPKEGFSDHGVTHWIKIVPPVIPIHGFSYEGKDE